MDEGLRIIPGRGLEGRQSGNRQWPGEKEGEATLHILGFYEVKSVF